MDRREMLQLAGMGVVLAGGVMTVRAAEEEKDIEVRESKQKQALAAKIGMGKVVIGQTYWVEAQIGDYNSAVTIDLDFDPFAVIAFISDIDLGRSKDGVKIAKMCSYVDSAQTLGGKNFGVRVVYGLRACDETGKFLPGRGRITLVMG